MANRGDWWWTYCSIWRCMTIRCSYPARSISFSGISRSGKNFWMLLKRFFLPIIFLTCLRREMKNKISKVDPFCFWRCNCWSRPPTWTCTIAPNGTWTFSVLPWRNPNCGSTNPFQTHEQWRMTMRWQLGPRMLRIKLSAARAWSALAACHAARLRRPSAASISGLTSSEEMRCGNDFFSTFRTD